MDGTMADRPRSFPAPPTAPAPHGAPRGASSAAAAGGALARGSCSSPSSSSSSSSSGTCSAQSTTARPSFSPPLPAMRARSAVHQSSGSGGGSSTRSSSSASSSDYWDEDESDTSRSGLRLKANDGTSRRTSTATSATSASSSDDEDDEGEVSPARKRRLQQLAGAPTPTTTAGGRPRAFSDPRSAEPPAGDPTPSTSSGSLRVIAELRQNEQEQPTAGPSKARRPAPAPSPSPAAAAPIEDDLELCLLAESPETPAWEDENQRSVSFERRLAGHGGRPDWSSEPSSQVASSSRTWRDSSAPGLILPLHAARQPSTSGRWRSPSPSEPWDGPSSRPQSLLESLRQALVRASPAPFEGALAYSLLYEANLPLSAPLISPEDVWSSTARRHTASISGNSPGSPSATSLSTSAKLLRSTALIVFPAVAYFTISVAGLALAGNLFFLFGRLLGFYTAAYRACFWAMIAVAAGLFYYCGFWMVIKIGRHLSALWGFDLDWYERPLAPWLGHTRLSFYSPAPAPTTDLSVSSNWSSRSNDRTAGLGGS